MTGRDKSNRVRLRLSLVAAGLATAVILNLPGAWSLSEIARHGFLGVAGLAGGILLYLIPLWGGMCWVYDVLFVNRVKEILEEWEIKLLVNDLEIDKSWLKYAKNIVPKFSEQMGLFYAAQGRIISLAERAGLALAQMKGGKFDPQRMSEKFVEIIGTGEADGLLKERELLETFINETVYEKAFRKTPSEVHEWCVPLTEWASKMLEKLDGMISELQSAEKLIGSL